MPHLCLEYSANVVDEVEHIALFKELHEIMALASDVQAIKSRAVKQELFFIGDGSEERAFIHLSVCLLAGRSVELKSELSRKLHASLKGLFPKTRAKCRCDFTVSIEDMDPAVYTKESLEKSSDVQLS
jgi:5-carboxymethyl-2-hydroxymuconate isomerase